MGENVTELNKDKNDLSVNVKKMEDINNPQILEVFPDIMEKTNHNEEGMQLLFKITEDINLNNEVKNKKMEKIFSSKRPLVTYVLIGLCILMFIITGGSSYSNVLLKYGANLGVLVKNGEYFRLVTSMFLHAGVVHIFFNLYSLYIVGAKIEDFFGKWKFLLIYLLSGIAGNLLSIGFNSEVVSVGASDAIFGLFGALLYFGYTYRGYIGSIIKSQILPIIIYNLILGFVIPGIDISAHIGGLIGGILVSKMVGTIENKEYKIVDMLLCAVYFGFLIYFGIVM